MSKSVYNLRSIENPAEGWGPFGPWRLCHHMQIVSSCRKLQYGHKDTLNIKICPLFQERKLDVKFVTHTAAAEGQPPVLYWIDRNRKV